MKTKDQTLIMMVAISGSGKSYYLRTNFLGDFPEVATFLTENQLPLTTLVVEPDGIRREVTGDVSNITQDSRVWRLVDERLKSNLETYGYAILDATNVTGKTRRNTHKNFKCRKVAVVFEADLALAKERIKADIAGAVDRSKVPPFVVERQFTNFKRDVIGDEGWNGEWNRPTKTKIKAHLQGEFDEVKFVD